jgi:hypothetical protein
MRTVSRRSATILLLLIASCGPGSAGPATATDFVVDVDLIGDFFPQGDPFAQGWVRVAPRVTQHLTPRIVFTAAPVAEADTHGDIDRDTLYDDDDRSAQRALLRFERLSLRFDLGSIKLEVGKQPLTWGRTDLINPTDNLTPRDWTDPLREIRLSPWSLRANLEKGRWEGELALVPHYAPSRLPRLGGRWAPLEPVSVVNPLFPLVGPPELEVEFMFTAPEFPATTLDNLQTGVRFGRRGSRAEWALSYYRGFDDAAHLDVSLGTPDLTAGILPIAVESRFPRLDVAGADGVVLVGAWALRGEAGYFRFPEDSEDSFVLYEVDAEWTRGSWQLVAGYADFSGAERVAGLGALTGSLGAGPSAVATVSLDLAFLPAVFLHAGRALPTEWEVSFDATVGTRDADSLMILSGSWPVDDTLRLGAEVHLINGKTGSFFGSWRDNDRLQIFARLSY